MRCITVEPGVMDSAKLEAWPSPSELSGAVLIQTRTVGVCGTDAEILRGEYGQSPPGESRLIIGHEALAQVLDAPPDAGLAPGDYVVPMVRWPDPVPCPSCAVGEWDMCRNGQFTEHGIKGRHGFAVEQLRLSPDRLVPVAAELGDLGVLLEPASIVAKAWEHIERTVGSGQRTGPNYTPIPSLKP